MEVHKGLFPRGKEKSFYRVWPEKSFRRPSRGFHSDTARRHGAPRQWSPLRPAFSTCVQFAAPISLAVTLPTFSLGPPTGLALFTPVATNRGSHQTFHSGAAFTRFLGIGFLSDLELGMATWGAMRAEAAYPEVKLFSRSRGSSNCPSRALRELQSLTGFLCLPENIAN